MAKIDDVRDWLRRKPVKGLPVHWKNRDLVLDDPNFEGMGGDWIENWNMKIRTMFDAGHKATVEIERMPFIKVDEAVFQDEPDFDVFRFTVRNNVAESDVGWLMKMGIWEREEERSTKVIAVQFADRLNMVRLDFVFPGRLAKIRREVDDGSLNRYFIEVKGRPNAIR
jgi:hypothetical protein